MNLEKSSETRLGARRKVVLFLLINHKGMGNFNAIERDDLKVMNIWL